METRNANVIVGVAGGNAGKMTKNYKISIPNQWANEMELSKDNREVEISFDGEKIIIEKHKSIDDFLKEKSEKNHEIKVLTLFDNEKICTEIYADFTDKTLRYKNYTDNVLKTAFGVNKKPCWKDFEDFLENRCIPRTSEGIKEYLNVLGLYEYDALEIIKITKGKMSEDNLLLEIKEI